MYNCFIKTVKLIYVSIDKNCSTTLESNFFEIKFQISKSSNVNSIYDMLNGIKANIKGFLFKRVSNGVVVSGNISIMKNAALFMKFNTGMKCGNSVSGAD